MAMLPAEDGGGGIIRGYVNRRYERERPAYKNDGKDY
jgi:hypothetical protein